MVFGELKYIVKDPQIFNLISLKIQPKIYEEMVDNMTFWKYGGASQICFFERKY